jgi:hypothetical protein
MTEEIYVLEWSQKTSNFHIQAARHLMSRNRIAYRDNTPLNDYHVIHIGTRGECEGVANSCRSTLDLRRMTIDAIGQASRRAA